MMRPKRTADGVTGCVRCEECCSAGNEGTMGRVIWIMVDRHATLVIVNGLV